MSKNNKSLSAPFWIVWAVEFWERFGYYGFQAIIALYFTHEAGLTQKETIYLLGSFFAFSFGFIWVGGYIGDKVLGAKRSIILGAFILGISYVSFLFTDKETIYYTLAGIIIGNAIFKANPSSLISKMFDKGDSRLDGAMTMYYMAINIGALISMSITPILSVKYSYNVAFFVCGLGLLAGVLNFTFFYNKMEKLHTVAGSKPLDKTKLIYTLLGIVIAFIVVGDIIQDQDVCLAITAVAVTFVTLYFLYSAFSFSKYERNRMLVAFVLVLEAVIFFSLYFQMPTALTFFAENNVHLTIFGFTIPAAQYQTLNPFWIMVLSPILAIVYKNSNFSHVTKFCFGMFIMASSYGVLYATKIFAVHGVVSGWWLFLSYALSSLGELLISGLGLAMVAELCPATMSGFVMGFWFVSSMVASYLSAYISSFIAIPKGDDLTHIQTLSIYTNVFGTIAIIVLFVAIIMLISAPFLNKFIKDVPAEQPHHIDN